MDSWRFLRRGTKVGILTEFLVNDLSPEFNLFIDITKTSQLQTYVVLNYPCDCQIETATGREISCWKFA